MSHYWSWSRASSYSEISVKRTVDIDGKSTYYLNNSECRRKDIVGGKDNFESEDFVLQRGENKQEESNIYGD